MDDKKKRLSWIDYARGVAIILVVYKHAAVGFISSGYLINSLLYDIQEILYNLRMPLFFILSGVFIEKSLIRRGFKKFFSYKANTIIYPFLIWGIIQVLIQVIASSYTNSQKELSDLIYLLYFPRGIDPFWFLYTLFFIVIIYALLKRYLSLSKTKMMLTALCFYFLSFYIKTDLFSINDILFYFIYLILGVIASSYLLDKKVQNMLTSTKAFAIMIPIVILCQYYWYTSHKGLVWFTDLQGFDRIVFLPITFVGSLLIFQISFFLSKYSTLKILRYIGSHSLYIYVLHLIVTGMMRTLSVNLIGSNNATIAAILTIISGIFIPILFYKITKKLRFYFLFEPKLSLSQIYGRQ